MTTRQTPDLPKLWLLSDARNDAKLEWALATLPKHSAFVFRHYHLKERARRLRYEELKPIAEAGGHMVVLSGDADTAVEWDADGVYGLPGKLGKRPGLLRFATVHGPREIFVANRAKVDGVFLSPAFPTRSHVGEGCLGISIFHQLAARSEVPVIALGGMTHERADDLGWSRWAAIDGLS